MWKKISIQAHLMRVIKWNKCLVKEVEEDQGKLGGRHLDVIIVISALKKIRHNKNDWRARIM